MSADLVAFVRARLAEDEARAREAGGASYGLINHRAHRDGWSDLAEMDPVRRLAEFDDDDQAAFEHIARHSPARVLRDVTARRRMLALHAPADDDPGGPAYCPECVRYDGTGKPCPTVLLLAAPYAGHPDYLPDWAPDLSDLPEDR